MRYYFPFLDGALSYDCARCGSRCCRGIGFALGRSELVPLVRARPALAPFLQPSGALVTGFDFTHEGCFCLAPDGRCAIEVAEGRAAKPGTCRLFPFTRVYRLETVTVVEPHLLLCPLEDARGDGVRHAELVADLAVMGDEVPLLTATPPPGLPDDWVDREEAVRTTSAAHLDDAHPLDLAAALGGPAMADLWQWWTRSFRLDADADEEASFAAGARAIARPMALLTPALRLATLFTPGIGPWPRVTARLPSLVLAGAFWAALAARALGGTAPSLRSLGELWRATAAARDLLGRWPRPALLDAPLGPSPLPPPLDAPWQRLADALAGGRLPLGAAFDAVGDLPGPERFLVFRALAARAGALRLR